jgi:hypothetical protein
MSTRKMELLALAPNWQEQDQVSKLFLTQNSMCFCSCLLPAGPRKSWKMGVLALRASDLSILIVLAGV